MKKELEEEEVEEEEVEEEEVEEVEVVEEEELPSTPPLHGKGHSTPEKKIAATAFFSRFLFVLFWFCFCFFFVLVAFLCTSFTASDEVGNQLKPAVSR